MYNNVKNKLICPFIFHFEGQWGWPTFSISSVLGMLAGVLACTVESLGYYPTIAKMSG